MSKVLWFTGLSGSGKTTIAKILGEELENRGKSYCVLDGDDVRKNLHKNLGFSPEDIKENNRLIAELCKERLNKFDYILVPIISPFRDSRWGARKEFGWGFVEIYIDCSYENCKKRDTKGLYAKAERGELNNFIGLHVPYEPPENPEVIINSFSEKPKESAQKIIQFLGL